MHLAANTNGLASGNVINEAILHGLYEAIERDSEARIDSMHPDQSKQRVVSHDSITSPHLKALLAFFSKANFDVQIKDMTSDIQVAAFSANISEKDATSKFFVSMGMGAHLSPEVALSRALTEAAQSRLTYVNGTRDDIFPDSYYYDLHFKPGFHSGEVLPPQMPFSVNRKLISQGSFEADLETVLKELSSHGINQVFVYNLTKTGIDIPVVKVIVPGFKFNAH
jgi:thioglycine synthase